MPFFVNRNFENQLFEYISSMQAWNNARPINLGGYAGPSGGYGGPPGGFFGQLPQSRVAYDTSELAASGMPASGWSILHNLNHIRYRLNLLEDSISGTIYGIDIQKDDITIGSGITVLNFEGTVSVTSDSPSKITVTITASGGGGGTPGNSVVTETSFSQSPASGTNTAYSRSDHTHGTPYQPSREIVFTMPDTLVASTGGLRMYNQLGVNFHISKVFLAVATPPVSSGNVVVDINKNGSTVFTTQSNRPTITSGNYTGFTTTIDVVDFNDGDYLTMDIDEIGSGTSNLTAHVKLVDTLI